MKKHILKIKELIREFHCMGTYGLVELELNELEKLIESSEAINNNDCISDVGDCTPPDKFGTPTIKLVLANPCDFCKYDKYEGENKNKDACSHCAKSLKDNEYYR